jgi:hypothetical protein
VRDDRGFAQEQRKARDNEAEADERERRPQIGEQRSLVGQYVGARLGFHAIYLTTEPGMPPLR